MKRVLIALAGTAAGASMIIGVKATLPNPAPAGPLLAVAPVVGPRPGAGTGTGDANGVNAAAGDPGTAAAPAQTSGPVRLPAGDYTVTGPTEDTFFGPVQVRIKVSGTKIVDVTAVETPNLHGRSIYINEQATPMLRQQVLQAQSAAIDGVGGATITSEAYAQSLQAAIDQATAGHHD
jgi:uncharacterized protein with FMN-binding domain